ncbi:MULTISPECIES: molybdate ABC transporter permease subunit [Dethiosulfovibrio]|uniref:Molybdenum transport system permease n=2 Tax=Dethiosulfovibrio TaxID=47054 RepID=A0ABS9EJG8_9BACT|nr:MULTISPECIES: molybdate ABC transporter permease subunit [Dethiosulfovibrio]MCF4112887.1 molybdate ABC transporter permease subunit [Dethiosulfovibrio russensis]MCF4141351.1 molybdate ABC transporter permease subunit [Dethiosulfovibrio marinus]MCF4145681.1 molybdate ABC transporter permease subunit [Dethiosulfovibrio acidaminovorans]MEA3284586.1 molybdate ABC transporter permease subunit [Synergistota bacterium]
MIQSLIISLKVLVVDVPLLLIIGTSSGWLLAKKDFPGKPILETALMLPVALPPAVLGLYLLIALGSIPAMRSMGLLFSFPAASIAALIPSMPLIISASRTGFLSVPNSLEEAARTMGKGEWQIFYRITLPLARKYILAGLALSSARALGDFGVTLMIAGNIPGRTQTLPLYIYSQVESLEFAKANAAAAVLACVGVASLLFVRRMEGRS